MGTVQNPLRWASEQRIRAYRSGLNARFGRREGSPEGIFAEKRGFRQK